MCHVHMSQFYMHKSHLFHCYLYDQINESTMCFKKGVLIIAIIIWYHEPSLLCQVRVYSLQMLFMASISRFGVGLAYLQFVVFKPKVVWTMLYILTEHITMQMLYICI